MRVIKDKLVLLSAAGFAQTMPVAEGVVMLPGSERNVTILYRSAQLKVLAAETQTGRVSADIAVNFTVLYLDGTGRPRSIEAQSSQSVMLKIETATPRMHARVWGQVEEVDAQESGGRLNLRAALNIGGCVFQNEEETVVHDLEEAGPLARQEARFESLVLAADGRQRTLLSQSYPSDRDGANVLFASARVSAAAVQAVEQAVNVQGEVRISLACTSNETDFFLLQKTIPFEMSVEVPQARIGMEALAEVSVQELATEFKPGEDGDALFIEFVLQADVSAYTQNEFSLLTDLYSLRGDGLMIEQKKSRWLCRADAYESSQTYAQILTLPEGSAPLRGILGVLARPVAVEMENTETQLIAQGLVSVTLLYEGADGLTSVTQEQPFHLAFPPAAPSFGLGLCVSSAQAVQITQDSADIQLGFTLSGPTFVECSVEAVVNVEDSGEPDPLQAGVTVYYPTREETLWQIGKRFHMDPKELENLSADGDEPILIYRRITQV